MAKKDEKSYLKVIGLVIMKQSNLLLLGGTVQEKVSYTSNILKKLLSIEHFLHKLE